MDAEFSEMIQETIDALALAQAQLASLMEMMRNQGIDPGPVFAHVEEETTRLLNALTYMKYGADRQNGAAG